MMDNKIIKTGESETQARTKYYTTEDQYGDKVQIEVIVASNHPNDDTVEEIFIVRGIEDNGVDVYKPKSAINLFLSNILKLPCEGTRCHHPYDCCGHFYADPITIRKIGEDRWFCNQRWTRNI